MTFIKAIKFDITHGFYEIWKIIIGAIFFLAFVVYEFVHRSTVLLHFDSEMGKCVQSLGDLALFIFGGMKEYIPSPYDPFPFPSLWLLLLIFPCFITLWYPYNNLHGIGQNILCKMKSRTIWWFSKCFWCSIVVTGYFFIIWIVIFIATFIFGFQATFDISPFMTSVFELDTYMPFDCGWEISTQLIFAPWLVALLLSLLQMVLSLFIHPVFSLSISVIVLLASAYYCSPLLLGNYAMIIRSDQIMPEGMSLNIGIILTCLAIGGFVFIGLLRFKFYDIWGRETR